jgi:hypothetical protein
MVSAEGIESTIKRSFNNLQGAAGTEKHCKTSQASLMDRKWIATSSSEFVRIKLYGFRSACRRVATMMAKESSAMLRTHELQQ